MREEEFSRRWGAELTHKLQEAPSLSALAQVLDWVREKHERTQRQIAERAAQTRGLSRSSVNNLLAGRKPIGERAVLLPLARYCGVPEDRIGDVEAAWERLRGQDSGGDPRVPGPRAADGDLVDHGPAERDRHLATLRVMADIAGRMTEENALPSARALYEHVLATRRELLGERDAQTLHAAHNLGVVLGQLEDFATARRVLHATFEARRDTLGAGHPSTLSSMDALATAHAELGEHSTARRLLTDCLDHRRRILSNSPAAEHQQALNRLDYTAGKLLVVLHQLGDLDAIEAIQASLPSMDDLRHEDADPAAGSAPPRRGGLTLPTRDRRGRRDRDSPTG
ncbi:tetratricopeptide repeat protein [Actinoplanes sp. NPDC051859]|uniref:helix-turn-helix domain-containing protein n=1 Tax=Actinoplanes sp. NPDC051859 TaxID=3363909 RepID=UPI003795E7C3